MLDPDRYFTNDLSFLKTRYIDVVTQLAGLYQQRYDSIVAERKARSHAYGVFEPIGTRDSHAARERYADASSLMEWLSVKDCDHRIQDCIEEKELLLHLIGWAE